MFACTYCGRTPPAVTLEVDHIHPSSKGGTDEHENLITACFDCNRGKGDVELGDAVIVTANPEKLKLQRERAEQLLEYNAFCFEQRQEQERLAEMVSNHWLTLKGYDPEKYILTEDRLISLRRFIERLSVVEVLDAVDIAWSNKPGSARYDNSTWKYFCGVCWNKIKQQGGTANG